MQENNKICFISGSRKYKAIPHRLILQLTNQVNDLVLQGYSFVVGDAAGIDYSVQLLFYNKGWSDRLTVYYSGSAPRFLVSDNQAVSFVRAEGEGRAFHTCKDKFMTDMCSMGIVIYDGVSTGSKNNVMRLRYQNKPVTEYIGE